MKMWHKPAEGNKNAGLEDVAQRKLWNAVCQITLCESTLQWRSQEGRGQGAQPPKSSRQNISCTKFANLVSLFLEK